MDRGGNGDLGAGAGDGDSRAELAGLPVDLEAIVQKVFLQAIHDIHVLDARGREGGSWTR